MTPYADPTLCPECRTPLPLDPSTCPHCGLPLTGPLAVELFQTLQVADGLLVRLRETEVDQPAVPAAPDLTPAPATNAYTRRPRKGLRAASVPKILLGLGALCLLVAAVIFLAVAWSWLGVGGRTAVLVGLTLAAGGTGSWLASRGLRVAGESLTTVSLGLVVLDVVGADNAGWFGDLGSAGLSALVGGALLVASLVLLSLPTRLVAPQVVAALGLWIVAVGVSGLTERDQLVATGAVLAFAGFVGVGRVLGLTPLTVAGTIGGGTWWVILLGLALEDALTHADLRALWLEGHGWGLLTASILLVLPALASPHPDVIRASAAASAVGLTASLGVFAVDDGLTRLTVAVLVALTGWAVASHLTRGEWALVPRVPLALATMPALGVLLAALGEGAERIAAAGAPFTSEAGLRLSSSDVVVHPALVIPTMIGVLVGAALLPPQLLRAPWLALSAPLVTLAGIGTLALEPVPLWTVTVGLGAVALGLTARAVHRTDRWSLGFATAGVTTGVVGLGAALPSDWLSGAATLVLVVAAGALLATGRPAATALLGGAVLPMATAMLLWSAGEVFDVDLGDRVAPVLVVLGLLAIVLARIELEVPAGIVALVVASAGYESVGGGQTWLALHLTLAGALVTTSALVHPSRRQLGWLGGLLLAAATWVRLADLGVHAPEAYTLPSATALVLVGLARLYRDPESSTGYALVPGLSLATIPSLLWVLTQDPITLRAGLLGLGCLTLLLAGTRLRWHAPLLVGAGVGALLVLRELAPYALQTPQWIAIGLAGTLLTLIGVTWERRVNDLQRAGAYLARLR